MSLTADTEVRNAAEWIKAMRMATATGVRMGLQSEEGVDFGEECVVGVMDVVGGGQGCVGVLEVESLLESVPKP